MEHIWIYAFKNLVSYELWRYKLTRFTADSNEEHKAYIQNGTQTSTFKKGS